MRNSRFITTTSVLDWLVGGVEALNYVSSNVTMQIKALRMSCSVRLFDRLGKQLVLTTVGKTFLTHVQSILDELDEARSVVHENETLR